MIARVSPIRTRNLSPASRVDWSRKGRNAALNLDYHWARGRGRNDGPIDVVDFFSGCGGMSAGFLAVNSAFSAYRIAMAVDIDPDANATYEANIGITPQAVDIAELARNPSSAKKRIQSVRSSKIAPLVLIGCAPCQGFSSHRNSAGEGDSRNPLFLSFAKLAAEIRPEIAVIENVPELLTDRYWGLVSRAREILGRSGYFTRIAVHNMTEFGVPQHRFRALIVAMRRPFRMPKGFLVPEKFRTVRDAIGGLPPIAAGGRIPTDPMHFTASHRDTTIQTIMAVPRDGGRRPWDAGPECLRRAAAKQGRAAYEDVYGRLWWDRPSITITAYARNPASGRYVHPEQHRGLSIREAALLQSFPRDYQFMGSFDSQFRQIGNAVPPAFSAFLATHLLGELTREPPTACDQADIVRPLGQSFSRLIPALKAGHRKLSDASRADHSTRVA